MQSDPVDLSHCIYEELLFGTVFALYKVSISSSNIKGEDDENNQT